LPAFPRGGYPTGTGYGICKGAILRKRYEDLTFADDFMFCHVMQDESICISVIETLLGIQVDHVEYLNFQQSVHPDFDSRGVRFDVYVRDSNRL